MLHKRAVTSLDRHDLGVILASHSYTVMEYSYLSIETVEPSYIRSHVEHG